MKYRDPHRIASARAVDIYTEATRRGARLTRVGQEWIGPCPLCGGRDRFSVNSRKRVFNCRGCQVGGDVIQLVQHLDDCDFAIAVANLTGTARVLDRDPWADRNPGTPAAPSRLRELGVAQRTEAALAIWKASRPTTQTLVATYCASRGIVLSSHSSLRFNPGLRHPSGTVWPAMVALVTQALDGKPIGIHRTFLAHNGNGKAPVRPAKMMLGPCRGGVIRLGDPQEVLTVGEGIETCLSVMQATGHPAWAALSTSGLRALHLPLTVRSIIVLADGDDAGEAAAQQSAWRWKCEGRSVRIARPPRGMDFNDVLMGRASFDLEATA